MSPQKRNVRKKERKKEKRKEKKKGIRKEKKKEKRKKKEKKKKRKNEGIQEKRAKCKADPIVSDLIWSVMHKLPENF